ncbi:nucleolar protein NOP2 [Histoplasma capsulatum H143]|uniref:Nucleolar protein NOP2 n=1 Tax=Ajellomyces capsulatus (strain H143) TaxID=544712 RepID=C6HB58_AJECH|nr:nucleolar protein NOP2 [Histoplasma capsulatum H143]
MKASRVNTISVSDKNFSLDLIEYLQQMSRTSALVKLLDEFRDQVRLIKKVKDFIFFDCLFTDNSNKKNKRGKDKNKKKNFKSEKKNNKTQICFYC